MPATKTSRKRRAARAVARPRKRTRMARMTRSVRPSSTTMHSFIRKGASWTITGNAVYTPYQAVSDIKLSSVINSTEFGNLYDQYKIKWVKLQFWLRVDPSAQSATTASYPKLYWFRDQDDQTLASQNEMRERSNLKIAVLRPDRPITIWIKPNVLNQVYRGVATVSYVPVWNQFLDMTNQDVNHYGIKYNIDNFTNTNYIIDGEQTYYFDCKNTR